LQEEEVIQTIRLLTHFGQAMQDPNASQENLQVELGKASEGTKVNLAQLLEVWPAQVTQGQGEASNDTPLLMKAAESMAIKFALDRYRRGDVKVNAVHEMMEHMSRQMDTLRQILRVQEDKMSRPGCWLSPTPTFSTACSGLRFRKRARKAFCSRAKLLCAAAQCSPVRRTPV
jgi:hypothetical protein